MAIIKILSRSTPSYNTLLKYITGKSTKFGEVISHNFRSINHAGRVRELIENETYRKLKRKNQVYLYHEILSFHPSEDTKALTIEALTKLGKEYIKLRGEDCLMIGAIHQDKKHQHIHFAVSGLKYRSGKSSRLSKTELLALKIEFQRYHNEELGITRSNPEHGKGRSYLGDKARYAIINDYRVKNRREIEEIINICLRKAKSKHEFFELLTDMDLPYYERTGIPVGVISGETKHRFKKLNIELDRIDELRDDSEDINDALNEIETLRYNRKANENERDV